MQMMQALPALPRVDGSHLLLQHVLDVLRQLRVAVLVHHLALGRRAGWKVEVGNLGWESAIGSHAKICVSGHLWGVVLAHHLQALNSSEGW